MHGANIRMPRWLVVLAVVGLIFAVMTPAAVEAGTPLNAQYFTHSGDIYVPTGINDSAIAAAVAAPNDGKFIQMGPESSIIMMFPVDYYALPDGTDAPDLRIDIWDDVYPALAEVLLSGDGVNYWSEGLFEDTADIDLGLGEIVKYVKIIQPLECDPGVPNFGTTIDSGFCIDQRAAHLGFDLDAVVALNSGEPEPTMSCPDGEYFVNSVGVDSDTPIVDVDVDDGHLYDITVSGWFYAGGWSTYGGIAYKDIRADAEFSETRYARVNALGWTETPGTAPGDPYISKGYAEEYFDLLVNFDGSLQPVDWGEYSTDHTYTIQRMATTGTMEFQFRVNEGYAQNDEGGLCVSLDMLNRAPIADANGPYTGMFEAPVAFDGSASWDPDGDPLTYEWDFGDGSSPVTGESPSHTYAVEGFYTATLTVTDPYGLSDTSSTPVVISLVPPTNADDCAAAGAYFVPAKADPGVPNTSPPDSNAPVETVPLVAGHVYDIDVFGTYYAGGDTIRADAKYTQNKTQRALGTGWTDEVQGYPNPAELLELVLDTDANGMFDRVAWGAYNSDHMYSTVEMGTGTPAAFGFQINDFYASNNDGGLCVLLAMRNQDPTADPNGPYVLPLVAGPFDGSGSSDPEDDPLTYAWDFGDGNTGTGVDPWNTYAEAGIYDVCLTVSDPYGGVSDEVCTTAVVYDPSGGFVTGGGWIDSPEGAYTAESLMTGKATFGFISKYKKGAAVPTGSTEFRFKTGGLNFHSMSYDWLVVTGSDYAKFKGVGTINGEGTFKFQIWAGDGDPDTFRIKIWTEAGGVETIVYDNGMNQPIGGGSIVIHTKK